jgi:hypothetical protein
MKLMLWSDTPMEKEIPMSHAASFVSYHQLVLFLIDRGVIAAADMPQLTNNIVKVKADAGR